jgi:hypothetical protein
VRIVQSKWHYFGCASGLRPCYCRSLWAFHWTGYLYHFIGRDHVMRRTEEN